MLQNNGLRRICTVFPFIPVIPQLHGDAVFARFAAIPDVVEHGLFLNGIDTIVIARGDTMEVRRRGQARSR